MSEKLKYIKPTDILVRLLVNLIQVLELALLVSSFSYPLPFFKFFFILVLEVKEKKNILMNDLQNIVGSLACVICDKLVTVLK